MGQKALDLRGVKVGQITFIEPTADTRIWNARCDCGTTFTVRHTNVRDGSQKSCGCSKKKHGLSQHKGYKAWAAMVARCVDPANRDYPRCGGRGITVDPRWLEFEKFWEDMGMGWVKGCTLQRINKDAEFAAWNVVWATKRDLARHRAPRVLTPAAGGRMSVAELSEKYGISESTIRTRIRRGWPPARIIAPVDVTFRSHRSGRS